MPIEPMTDAPGQLRTPEGRQRDENQDRPKPGHSPLGWVIFAVLILVAAALVFFVGWLPRHKTKEDVNRRSQAEQTDKPRVNVQVVRTAPAVTQLMVPGTTLAYTEAYVYARASGYVTQRLVDIGDRVRKGQLLAVIDAPDLDQQVAQARSALRQSESNLAQMQAQLHLAQVTWERYKVLVARGVFSRQDGDNQEANERVAEANVGATQNTIQGNRENLERLVVLQGYERVTAPFSGVVTARNIDVGALISAQGSGLAESTATGGTTGAGAQGNNQGASGALSASTTPTTGGSQGGEMFVIANINPLRVLVSVPEAYSSSILVGQRAQLSFQEVPNGNFEGRVARTSGSIDQNTRTLLVEVHAANPNGRLLPGMYVVVNFEDVASAPPLLVPGEAIVVRNGASTVAVVQNNIVHYEPVQIGRDYGDQTEIVSGLKAGDVIVPVITDEIRDGGQIESEYPKQAAQGAPAAQSDKSSGNQGNYGPQGLSNSGGKAGAKGGSGGGGGKKGSGSQQ